MKVRHLEKDDLETIMEIIKYTVQEMNKNNNFQWDETYPNREVFLNDIKERTLYGVITEEGNLVGLGALNFESPEEYNALNWESTNEDYVIHRLAVDVNYRGCGIGEFLIKDFEKKVLERGKKYVRIDTNYKNLKAQSLFEKMGYKKSGKMQLHGIKEEFICYEKRLSD